MLKNTPNAALYKHDARQKQHVPLKMGKDVILAAVNDEGFHSARDQLRLIMMADLISDVKIKAFLSGLAQSVVVDYGLFCLFFCLFVYLFSLVCLFL